MSKIDDRNIALTPVPRIYDPNIALLWVAKIAMFRNFPSTSQPRRTTTEFDLRKKPTNQPTNQPTKRNEASGTKGGVRFFFAIFLQIPTTLMIHLPPTTSSIPPTLPPV